MKISLKMFPVGDIWNTICVGGRVISKRGGLPSLFHQPVFVIESIFVVLRRLT